MSDKRSSKQGVSGGAAPDVVEFDATRRAALRRVGALAGAAPAVALLLAPSDSRAEFVGSCVDANNCKPLERPKAPSGPDL